MFHPIWMLLNAFSQFTGDLFEARSLEEIGNLKEMFGHGSGGFRSAVIAAYCW
jgi:hypothetical protein